MLRVDGDAMLIMSRFCSELFGDHYEYSQLGCFPYLESSSNRQDQERGESNDERRYRILTRIAPLNQSFLPPGFREFQRSLRGQVPLHLSSVSYRDG